MLNNFKPLEAKDIEAGAEYISVRLGIDCSLLVARIKVLAIYKKSGRIKFTFSAESFCTTQTNSIKAFVECYGLNFLQSQACHRFLVYCPEDYDFLTEFVGKSDALAEWLSLLGVTNPETKALALAEASKNFIALVDAGQSGQDSLNSFFESLSQDNNKA